MAPWLAGVGEDNFPTAVSIFHAFRMMPFQSDPKKALGSDLSTFLDSLH